MAWLHHSSSIAHSFDGHLGPFQFFLLLLWKGCHEYLCACFCVDITFHFSGITAHEFVCSLGKCVFICIRNCAGTAEMFVRVMLPSHGLVAEMHMHVHAGGRAHKHTCFTRWNIFSRDYWSSIFPLWRNVCSNIFPPLSNCLSVFWVFFFVSCFTVKSWDLFRHFVM